MRNSSHVDVVWKPDDTDEDNGGGGNANNSDDGKGTGASHTAHSHGHADGGNDQNFIYANTNPANETNEDGGNAVAGNNPADLGEEHGDDGDSEKGVVFSLVYQGCFQDGLIFKDLDGGTRLFREVREDGQPPA